MTESDLRDRITKAVMDAMGCKSDVSMESRLWAGSQFCARHKRLGWPCGAVTDTADALLPFVRDEVANELHSVADRLTRIVAELLASPEHGKLEPFARFAKWLRSRADEVRRG